MTTPSLREMFGRLVVADGQSRAARSVEGFGWIELALGTAILFAPFAMATLLRLPPLNTQAANYTRIVGLLVSGLGVLYVALAGPASDFLQASWQEFQLGALHFKELLILANERIARFSKNSH